MPETRGILLLLASKNREYCTREASRYLEVWDLEELPHTLGLRLRTNVD